MHERPRPDFRGPCTEYELEDFPEGTLITGELCVDESGIARVDDQGAAGDESGHVSDEKYFDELRDVVSVKNISNRGKAVRQFLMHSRENRLLTYRTYSEHSSPRSAPPTRSPPLSAAVPSKSANH